MKAVLVMSAIIGAAGIVPEAAFGRIALTEPFWLAIWGLTLIIIASAVRSRRRKERQSESLKPVRTPEISAPDFEAANG
jgi:hypothetical protein